MHRRAFLIKMQFDTVCVTVKGFRNATTKQPNICSNESVKLQWRIRFKSNADNT